MENKFEYLFNENMTFIEAQYVLFSNVDGKTKEEIDMLFEAWEAVLPAIIARETKEGMNMIW